MTDRTPVANPPAGIVVCWMNAAGTGKAHAHSTCGTSKRFITAPTVIDFYADRSPELCQRCQGRGYTPATDEAIAAAGQVYLEKLNETHPREISSNAIAAAKLTAWMFTRASELVNERRPARPEPEETPRQRVAQRIVELTDAVYRLGDASLFIDPTVARQNIELLGRLHAQLAKAVERLAELDGASASTKMVARNVTCTLL